MNIFGAELGSGFGAELGAGSAAEPGWWFWSGTRRWFRSGTRRRNGPQRRFRSGTRRRSGSKTPAVPKSTLLFLVHREPQPHSVRPNRTATYVKREGTGNATASFARAITHPNVAAQEKLAGARNCLSRRIPRPLAPSRAAASRQSPVAQSPVAQSPVAQSPAAQSRSRQSRSRQSRSRQPRSRAVASRQSPVAKHAATECAAAPTHELRRVRRRVNRPTSQPGRRTTQRAARCA